MKAKKSVGQVRAPLIVAVLFVVILAFLASRATAYFKSELDVLKSELDSLKKDQVAMKNELAELKTKKPVRTARSKPKKFKPIELSTKEATTLGDQDAPVIIVEFTDYQCPYCRKYSINTLPYIIRGYVETGKLRYLVRELPVESRHPYAVKASEAALCAGDQGKYWEMHDKLFENQSRLRPEDLKSHAQSIGLNSAQFDQCLESGDKRKRVQEDVKAGLRAGVRGTPTFFLGLTNSEERDLFQATELIRGAKTFPEFAIVFDDLLAKTNKKDGAEKTDNSEGQ